MKSHIITIGDEILVGQTIDTNSAYIAKHFNELGISISEIQSVKDEQNHIIEALQHGLIENDIIIVTGGLGPTNDDITKKVLTQFFNDELVIYPNILKKIEDFFKAFNKPFKEVHRLQAMLPKNATILENDFGTASGMWFKKDNKHILSFPGVPYEMKGLLHKFTDTLKKEENLGNFFHKTILFQGLGESNLAEKLKDWEAMIRSKGITVSYLPSVGQVKLRLTGQLNQKEFIIDELARIKSENLKYCFGEEDEKLEQVLGQILKQKNMTVGTVESCTAGGIASKIVSIPGSSSYFQGSILSYSNRLKQEVVGVPPELIENHGAVSQQVVESMAQNGVQKLNVDYCISTSGIAGPDGGTKEKPVGLVWIGIASKNKVWSKQFNFGHTRERNIEATIYYALNFLRRILLEID